MGASEEELLKAVAVSDLVTIHQKTGIGRLSAYCGAISAGCGAGAGIAYLRGGRFHAVAHTVVNAIAILSGTICDGAKPSCAAAIAPKPKLTEKYPIPTGRPVRMPVRYS